MLDQRARETATLAALLDAALLFAAFALAFSIRNYVPVLFKGAPSKLDFAGHLWAALLAVPLFWILASNAGLYAIDRGRSWMRIVASVALTFVYLGMLTGLAIFLFQAKGFSRAVFSLFLGIGFLLIVAEKLYVRRAAARRGRRASDYRIFLIVGANEEATLVHRKLAARYEDGVRVVGHVLGPGEMAPAGAAGRILGPVARLERIVEEWIVDEVVFALPFPQLMACEREIGWCEEVGKTVHLKVDLVRTLFAKTYPSELEGTPMLTIASTPRDPVSLSFKRAMDIVVSASALALLSPVLLVCACAVRLTSRGPALFKQERVGLNGRTFRLYKFRSMYRDAEERRRELEGLNEMTGPVFKMRHDPRVTPVGRLLRKFSLDEIPQLINVLQGHLSLVGPRPPLPDEVRRYERWQRRRLSVKPGITCLWQISGRNSIGFEEWMRMDLHYIDNWSLKQDLKILLRTVPAVVLTKGAR